MNKISVGNLIAFHPGYYILEYLNHEGMTQEELAERLNTNKKKVSELVNGKINLDDELITNLSLALGTSETVWRNLNNKYKEVKAKIDAERNLESERPILEQMDYSYWVKLDCVKNTRDFKEKVEELKRHFRISTLKVLSKKNFLVQYRTSVKEVESKNIINSNAWVQTALNIAVQKNVSSIDLDYLKTKLPDIRKMTKQNPEVFLPELNRIFENSGVAFVILPNLKNCGINGAVKWIGKDRILLAVNDRSKYADQFWFTLFHEIKHVFQRKKGHMIVTPIGDNGITNNLDLDRLEKEADQFAQNHLINPADYKAFIKENDFSRRAVLEFSEGIQIHPGVVVGRLQREKYLDYRHLNDLKIQYHFD